MRVYLLQPQEINTGLPRAWEPYTIYTSDLLNQDLCRGAWELHFFQMPQVGRVTWRERQWRQEVESLHAKGSGGLPQPHLTCCPPICSDSSGSSHSGPSPTCLRVFVLTLLPNASLSASLCSSRYQLTPPHPFFPPYPHSTSLPTLPFSSQYLLPGNIPMYLSIKFCVCMFPAKKMEASRPRRLFHSLLFPMTPRYFHVTFSAHSVFAERMNA